MDLGPYSTFIWLAYVVTFGAISLLIGRAIAAEQRQQRALASLEAQGIRRRSDAAAGPAEGR